MADAGVQTAISVELADAVVGQIEAVRDAGRVVEQIGRDTVTWARTASVSVLLRIARFQNRPDTAITVRKEYPAVKQTVPTVVVIDDDEAIRRSLKLLLHSINLPVVVHASAQEYLQHFEIDQPGCLVVDVRMPGMSGIELQQQLNLRGAMIPVIFITGHGDISMAVDAMQHGAFDFLPKPFRDQDLLDRIQSAIEKDGENRREVGRGEQIRARIESLTSREREVLALVTRGSPNKIIAADLGVSQRTIEIHRAHVMEKMQARSLAQLVRMTLQLKDPTTPLAGNDNGRSCEPGGNGPRAVRDQAAPHAASAIPLTASATLPLKRHSEQTPCAA